MKQIIKKVIRIYNRILYTLFCIFPINNNLICFESEGDLSDNSYALYDYFKTNIDISKYKIVWFVANKNNKSEKNIIYLNKKIGFDNIKKTYILATCKYLFFDHVNIMESFNKRNNQKIIFLGHGCGFKSSKISDYIERKSIPDEIYLTSDIFKEPMYRWSGYPKELMISMGYPRNDYLFKGLSPKEKEVIKFYKFNKYKKVFLWMPTYRESSNKELNEDNDKTKSGLPIIRNIKDLDFFNDFLCENNCLCCIKLHYLQLNKKIYNNKLSNIIFIKDNDINLLNIQLYQFIKLTDALITDYSSIYNDYLLLDKPIIFTLDDYYEYRESRGLTNDDFLFTLKGNKVYNLLEFKDAIIEIANNIDKYKIERNKWKNNCHRYVDGKASERILKHLGFIDKHLA